MLSSSIQTKKLSHKLIITTLVAFLFSATTFILMQYVTQQIVRNYTNKPEVISRQLQKKVNDLQAYISRNNIASFEILMLDKWMEKEDLAEVIVYRGDKLLYSSHHLFPNISIGNNNVEAEITYQNQYQLMFLDGEANLLISDLFGHRYTDYVTYFNLVVFFTCFICIMILCIRRKVSYIDILEKEIKIVEGGNLNYPITIKGNDELSILAEEINEMRKAFIVREQYANQMREVGSELMIGISHDLRTPLTALIGYLEVLEVEPNQTNKSDILKKCKNRAFQLTSLLNNLFEYFFVSTSNHEQLQMEKCTVKEAFKEVLKEHIFLLEQGGFVVENNIKLPDSKIQLDRGMLQRIFDNLQSNIIRYADATQPIKMSIDIKPHKMILTIQNQVLVQQENVQSTGLGLKVCEKIMTLLNGRFIYTQYSNLYTVQLHFSLCNEYK